MGRTSDAKERLLAAALDLIWTTSYGSVSVDDICTKAGVKKGSFYHFFPSKADLALAAYEEHWRLKRPQFDAIFSPQFPPLERLSRWCDSVHQTQRGLFDKYGHVCGCPYANVGAELATQDDRLRCKSEELLNRGLRYLETAIGDAQRAGDVSITDVKSAAVSVGTCLMGLLFRAKVQNDPGVLRELEPSVMRLLGAHVQA